MLYFAYGSNMSAPRLGERVFISSVIGVATLSDHVLQFHKQSEDGSAKCNLAHSGGDGAAVMGVVFDLPASEKPALDHFEGVGQGYEVRTVTVTLVDGQDVEVFTYWATRKDPSLKPYHWYKHHVLHGARTAGLPDHYIAKIEAVESIEDPSAERHRRQMDMYR